MSKLRFSIAFVALLSVLSIAVMNNTSESPVLKKHSCKVYECIELGPQDEMLSHLSNYSDVVDYFVVLEAKSREGSQSPEWSFRDMQESLKDYESQIIYIATQPLCKSVHPSAQQYHQKNQYLCALDECHASDIIFFNPNRQPVKVSRLLETISYLEKKPNEVVSLSTPQSHQAAGYMATYQTLKNELPAAVKPTSTLKSSLNWKAFFFPIKEASYDS